MATKKKAPAKKKRTTPAHQKNQKVVARGVVQGKSTEQIAKDLGISQRSVQRIAAEDETQFLITDAFAPYRGELRKMAALAIVAVEEALSAKKDDEADHRNRMQAVERYRDLVEMAQGKEIEETQTELRLMTAEAFFSLTTTHAKEN